jgi:hypothetical protein
MRLVLPSATHSYGQNEYTVNPRYKGDIYKGFPRYKGVRILIPSDPVGDGQTTLGQTDGQTTLGKRTDHTRRWTDHMNNGATYRPLLFTGNVKTAQLATVC